MILCPSSMEQTNRNCGGDHGCESDRLRTNVRGRILSGLSLARYDLRHGCGCGCRVCGQSCSRWFRIDRGLSKAGSFSPQTRELGSNLYTGGSCLLRTRPGSFHQRSSSLNGQVPGQCQPDTEAIVGGRKDSERHGRRCVVSLYRSWRPR